MKRCIRIVLIALLFLFGSFSIVLGQNIHVLVNIWEGTQATVVKNLYNNGNCHFSVLWDYCIILLVMKTVLMALAKTATKPQHATMLTGWLADVTGVYTNSNYQLIPDGITVYELIETDNPNYKTAHIAGKPSNVGEPTFGNIDADVDFFGMRSCLQSC